jgi:hypothetical protein
MGRRLRRRLSCLPDRGARVRNVADHALLPTSVKCDAPPSDTQLHRKHHRCTRQTRTLELVHGPLLATSLCTRQAQARGRFRAPRRLARSSNHLCDVKQGTMSDVARWWGPHDPGATMTTSIHARTEYLLTRCRQSMSLATRGPWCCPG